MKTLETRAERDDLRRVGRVIRAADDARLRVSSAGPLARRGWTRTTLKPGDKVTMTIHALKDGTHGGSFVSATRANGEHLTQTPPIAEP